MRRNDLIAGLSVAGLMLPEAVAYAGIAGLELQHGVFAAVAGCLGYAVAGRSRFAIVSPTSSSAAILAATLAVMPGDAGDKAALAALVVAMVGGLFLLASAARLGGFAGFISRPVLRGFAFGLAITIIVRQAPILVGTSVQAPDIFRLLGGLVLAAPSWNWISLAVGAVALAVLLTLKRWPFLPGAFLVLVAGVGLSCVLGLAERGVPVVGVIQIAPGWPKWPSLDWADYSRLVQLTLPLVLILFAESWGTIRAMSLRHGDGVEANRELGALGVANLASALAQGMPVGAGFSAGSASEAAGAATRATAVVAAIGLAVLIAWGAPLVAYLPQTVLAAVVIAALSSSLNPAPLLRLWRLDRDQYVALGAAVAVLALGVLNGMLVAIGLSLLALVSRLATPRVARLGRLGCSHDYVDVARHPEAVLPRRIAIWRPAQPLFFANAERVLAIIAARVRDEPAIRAVVLSLEESMDLDSTALDALIEFDALMRTQSVRVRFARLHDRARDLMAASGVTGLQARSSYSVDDAIVALENESERTP
ncbi:MULTISPECIES: SulP family inorganic anion transporter [unclassified Brevundimonas]|uniref:SulP family inorganic anion transporter n=1 Tax=unclassified Brevundimonas TaxID=2622653 RepID=UPI003F91F6FE